MKDQIIAVEIFALLMSAIILYGSLFHTEQKSSLRKALNYLIIVNMIALFADMLSWVYDGMPEHLMLLNVTTLLSMLMSIVLTGVFLYYVYQYISEKSAIILGPVRIVLICALLVLSIVCITIASTKGYMYTFEDGYYMPGEFYDLYIADNVLNLAIAALIIFSSVRYLSRRDILAISSYVVIPSISMLINLVNPDFSMFYPASSVSILVIYILLHAERERQFLEEELRHAEHATRDELTGLLNRRSYMEFLESTEDPNQRIGVIFCDINGLKYTNEQQGTAAGDKLICDFASLLKIHFRKREIFRINGDEFVILLPGISEALMETRLHKVESTMKEFEFPLASMGCCHGSRAELTYLLKQAEANMQEQKLAFYQQYPLFKH
ncbi:MAG: GGDEF domain-containing protein [Clostridiales bacterium]|nr:GGDEF domain-containing protein [Candidatus Blautia equi]